MIGHVQSLGKRSCYRLMCAASSVTKFLMRIPASNTGKDLLHMIASKIPQKPGSRILLQHESQKLLLNKSLQEQGFHGEVKLHYVYTQLDLRGAWKYLFGFRDKFVDDEDSVLEEITRIDGIQSLTFGDEFDPSLENITLPGSSQGLIFWQCFQSEPGESHFAQQFAEIDFWLLFQPEPRERRFARQLAKLDFCFLNQSLENVTLPGSLQGLIFGNAFNQSLERVTLPSSLQKLTFGYCFNQSLENVALPGSLQSLTFVFFLNQSLEKVTLPGRLQSLTFGCRSLCPTLCKA